MKVIVVGAGLAGCEAAWQLAEENIQVELYEKKKSIKNEIQKLDTFCELVCSNSFRSTSTQNASGILKKELELLNSFILSCAKKTQIPSDDALAVDRIEFSKLVDQKIRSHKNIKVIDQEFLDLKKDEIILIATGPLMTNDFKIQLENLLGKQKLFYLDASSPIIEKDSIDFNVAYYKSRHNNDNSYICLPLNEEQFEIFYKELICAKQVMLKQFEKEIFFKGCMPIEQMAKKSKKILLKTIMSSNNLENKKKSPFAVIQLRQDNVAKTLYNMVGFQTNLTWSEQKRVFSLIPGLKNAIFKRYGVMHKNYYLNSPKILNNKLQLMRSKNIFFAGQITGVEGYIECVASGVAVAWAIKSYIKNIKFTPFPNSSVIGSLINYITNSKHKRLNPMKSNMSLIKLDDTLFFSDKKEKNQYIYENSIKEINYLLKKKINK